MGQMLNYFGLSFVVTFACMFGGWYVGGMAGLMTVIILGILEVSLSLDNAVVNAKEIKKMNAFWRKMFLTVGMLIAVFGMRAYFPLAIVSFTTDLGIVEAGKLALSDPKTYSETLMAAHGMIAGFGGAFLMLVFLDFFFDNEKDHHWIPFLERPLAALGNIDAIQILTTIGALYTTMQFLPADEGSKFFLAGIAGIVTFIIVGALEPIIKFVTGADKVNAQGQVAKAGLASFLYLEVLDASFSFDGVIGAFAITTDILIIMMGLAIGAMFVRSLTIVAVEKDTLAEYQYLEHGAFWAIGALAAIMFAGTIQHIPELVSGLLGAGILAIAFTHSILAKRGDAAIEAPEDGSVPAGYTNSLGPQ
jgi:hypothetical protein